MIAGACLANKHIFWQKGKKEKRSLDTNSISSQVRAPDLNQLTVAFYHRSWFNAQKGWFGLPISQANYWLGLVYTEALLASRGTLTKTLPMFTNTNNHFLICQGDAAAAKATSCRWWIWTRSVCAIQASTGWPMFPSVCPCPQIHIVSGYHPENICKH